VRLPHSLLLAADTAPYNGTTVDGIGWPRIWSSFQTQLNYLAKGLGHVDFQLQQPSHKETP
jgi:hypothetical protein